MTGRDDWTPEEFAILLALSESGAEEIAASGLLQRSVGAISTVRQGVLQYDNQLDTHGMLSRVMREFLESHPRLAKWAAAQLR